MQALNFLDEKPTSNWLDFLLRPDDLVKHIENKTFPNEELLIVQFCEQAEQEQIAEENKSDDPFYHTKKSRCLSLLALKCLAYHQFSMTFFKKCLLLQQQKGVIDELLRICEAVPLSEFANFDLSSIHGLAHQTQFAYIFTWRWIIHTMIASKLPEPAPKITVSNPMTMLDPTVQKLSDREKTLKILEGPLFDSSIKFLEQLILHPPSSLRLLTVSCFVLPVTIGNQLEKFSHVQAFHHATDMAVNELLCQLHFDLALATIFGVHGSLRTNNAYARDHLRAVLKEFANNVDICLLKYFDISRLKLRGYAYALGLSQEDFCVKIVAVKPPKTIGALALKPSTSTLLCAIPTGSKKEGEAERARKIVSNWTTSSVVSVGQMLNSRNVKISALLSAVQSALKNESVTAPKRLRLKALVHYLLAVYATKSDAVKNSGILELFESKDLAEIAAPEGQWKPLKTKTNFMPELSLLKHTDQLWQLLWTFEPKLVKTYAPRVQGNRLSAFWTIPATCQNILPKMTAGSLLQDIIAGVLAKSQQACACGDVKTAHALVDYCESEIRGTGSDVGLMLRWEIMRQDILQWLAAYGTVQEHEASTSGRKCVRRFKELLGETSALGLQISVPEEIWFLSGVFLLNVPDWTVLLRDFSGVTQSRHLDFFKVLAAMCYEYGRLDTNGFTDKFKNVRDLCVEFYKLMLPTFNDVAVQGKRGFRGEPAETTYREAPPVLISRTQFSSLIQMLKETSALSFTISYLIVLVRAHDENAIDLRSDVDFCWPDAKSHDHSSVNTELVTTMTSLMLEHSLSAHPNNLNWILSLGDLAFYKQKYAVAMRAYTQAMIIVTNGFETPFSCTVKFSEAVIRRMIKSCSSLKCHAEETLLAQFLISDNPVVDTNDNDKVKFPDFAACLKALEESVSYDTNCALYPCFWSVDLLEFLIYALEKKGENVKLSVAIQCMGQQELNSNNPSEVKELAVAKRKKLFCWTLANEYS